MSNRRGPNIAPARSGAGSDLQFIQGKQFASDSVA